MPVVLNVFSAFSASMVSVRVTTGQCHVTVTVTSRLFSKLPWTRGATHRQSLDLGEGKACL